MFERVSVLDQLTTEGVPAGDTAKVARINAYIQKLKDHQEICWPELADDFRRNYYDLFDVLIPQVFKSDNPMVIYKLVEHMDFTKENEANAVAEFARTCDPQRHQLTLLKLAESNVPAIKAIVAERLNELQQAPASQPG